MQRAALTFFAVAVVVATVGIGGVHTPVAIAICALAFGALALQLLQLRTRANNAGFYLSIPLLGVSLLFAASLLQIIPVPEFVQRVLSPEGHNLVEGGLQAAGLSTDVGWRTLSVDPGATSDRAIRFGALLLMGLFAGNLRSRQAWVTVGRTILVAALVVLVAGAALYVTGTRELFGVYQSAVGFRAPSTFVNLNQGAAFFGLAALVGVILAFGAEKRRALEAAGFWAAAMLFAVIGAMHDSDGVALAFVASLGVGALVLWIRAGRPTTASRQTKVASVILAFLAAGLSYWLDLHHVAARFGQRLLFEGEHGNRLELMRAGAAMVADFWPFGGGAGAVESVIPGYMNWSSTTTGATIPVLENDTLEVLFGFGVFVGGIALAAIASAVYFAWRHAFDPRRTLRRAALFPSAAFLLFVSQLHFPLFALGVGVPAVIWIESLLSRRMLDTDEHSLASTGHVFVPLPWAAAMVCAIVAFCGAAATAHYTAYAWEFPEKLDDEAASHAITLRPADHRIFVRLATQAAHDGQADKAARLAEHARQRNGLPRVRLFLARAKANAGDETGARAIYDALMREGHGDTLLIRAVLADFESPQTRSAIFSEHPELWSKVAATSLRIEGGPAAADFSLALVDEKPEDRRAYQVATETYLSMKQPYLARLWAELLLQRQVGSGEDIEGVVLLARALLAAGDRANARVVLDRALDRNPSASSEAMHRLALSMRPDVVQATDSEAEQLRAHYQRLCTSPIPPNHLRVCWDTEAWLAEQSGDVQGAQSLLERLHRKFDDPVPLAYLLLRNKLCHEFDKLIRNAEPESQQHKRLKDLSSRCSTDL